ncbi:MAG TPA: HEAT repeat domain-containing protein [Pirellulales bacterium]|jgi:HEAT repeat protein|nr:HEAT repeat domain-containing protein [Pirellulales bacterium]
MTRPVLRIVVLTLAGLVTTTLVGVAEVWAAEDAATLAKGLASDSVEERAKAADGLGELRAKAKSAVPALVKALKDKDAGVRGHAAHALSEIGDKSASVVDGLFALVGDQDALVRRAALRALRSLRLPHDLLMPKMVKTLKSASPADAAAALATMAEAGEKAVPFLTECLGDKEACYWACLALADIGPAAKAAVPHLSKLHEREEPQVRLQALVALGSIGPDARPAVPAIVKSLESDKAAGVRYAAAYALGQIGAGDKASRAALSKAMEGDDAFLQIVAAWASARVAKEDKQAQDKATTLVLKGLTSERVDVRRAAARALAEIKPPPEVVAPVLIKAIQDKDPAVISNAVDALASLGPAIVPRLAKNGLQNKDLQLYAVRVLAKIGPAAKGAAPALAEALKEAEGEYRREVQFVLGTFGADAAPAVPELIKSLASDDDHVRSSAIYALGKIGPAAKEAAPELRKMLAGNDDFARFAATWALVRIDPKDSKLVAAAVPALIKGLSDERPLVRTESASTLGELGAAAKPALAELKKAAEDADANVSAAAKQAIEQINH